MEKINHATVITKQPLGIHDEFDRHINCTTVDEISDKLEHKEMNDSIYKKIEDEGKDQEKQNEFGERKEMKRKSKKDNNGRDFVCGICSKSYLSYPALYTHKRNKHNIIPITGKPNVFKNSSLVIQGKFKYSAFDSSINIKSSTQKLISEFYKICFENNLNENSIFFHPNYSIEDDYFMKILKYYNQSGLQKITLPTVEESSNNSIYHFLAMYLILLLEITKDKFYCELLVKFVFLLREFLNAIGWEYKKKLISIGIIKPFNISGDYCAKSSCEDLPDLMDDFVSVFLKVDPQFEANSRDLVDICQNFCFWLYINQFTFYKLTRAEE